MHDLGMCIIQRSGQDKNSEFDLAQPEEHLTLAQNLSSSTYTTLKPKLLFIPNKSQSINNLP